MTLPLTIKAYFCRHINKVINKKIPPPECQTDGDFGRIQSRAATRIE